MAIHYVKLSSPEIGGLWANYMNASMSLCLLKYFLHHNQDEEIKTLLTKKLTVTETQLQQMQVIFTAEKLPIPHGFSNQDINLIAPPLFEDPFALSFLYMMSRMEMINYSFITSNVAREDVLSFFKSCLVQSADLYEESTHILLAKGIYDRPPMIPYPKTVEYIETKTYVTDTARSLNALELLEVFFNIERNYFSIIFCMGLLQVVKDKQIVKYIGEGKKISERQIKTFNDILIKEGLLGTVPVSMLVTDSHESPFSEKLIMSLFQFLNSIDVSLIGHALSQSMRIDLGGHYSKFIGEILLYAGKGFSIMVERNWFEEPPHAPIRP